jgi:hypothetical protein
MNQPNQRPAALDSALTYLGGDVSKLLDVIHRTPGAARELEDHQLRAIAAWTQDGDDDIRAECQRRAESGRQFARYLGRGELAVTGTVHLRDAGEAEQS